MEREHKDLANLSVYSAMCAFASAARNEIAKIPSQALEKAFRVGDSATLNGKLAILIGELPAPRSSEIGDCAFGQSWSSGSMADHTLINVFPGGSDALQNGLRVVVDSVNSGLGTCNARVMDMGALSNIYALGIGAGTAACIAAILMTAGNWNTIKDVARKISKEASLTKERITSHLGQLRRQ